MRNVFAAFRYKTIETRNQSIFSHFFPSVKTILPINREGIPKGELYVYI